MEGERKKASCEARGLDRHGARLAQRAPMADVFFSDPSGSFLSLMTLGGDKVTLVTPFVPGSRGERTRFNPDRRFGEYGWILTHVRQR